MDLGTGERYTQERYRTGRKVLAWWYAGYLTVAVGLVAWYFSNLQWADPDPRCEGFWCPGGDGKLLRFVAIIGFVLFSAAAFWSWVALRVLLPRIRSGALAGTLAALSVPLLVLLACGCRAMGPG